MTVFSTDRLVVSRLTGSDVTALYGIFSNPVVMYWLADQKTYTLEETRSFVEESIANYDKYPYGCWGIKLKDESSKGVIGIAGFFPPSEVNPQPDMVIALRQDMWRKGLAREVGQALTSYAFHHLRFDRIVSTVDVGNIASMKLVKHLGFKTIEMVRNPNTGGEMEMLELKP